MSLSGHQRARGKNDEWLTPPEWLQALGPFDLDPCAPVKRPWSTAARHFTKTDDGLIQVWKGRVWLNPPFGPEAASWLRKMAGHLSGVALVPARTETKMFFESVWPVAKAICFVARRPHFHYVDGTRAAFNSGAPICLIAYSDADAATLHASRLGKVLKI